jgi:hypothetical protein
MEYVLQPPNSPTSPSFPHAFSGNPGGIRTGPPIKTLGGDGFKSRISSLHDTFFPFAAFVFAGDIPILLVAAPPRTRP